MKQLIKDLTEAIESGKGKDYGWEGEEGNEEDALKNVLRVVLKSQIKLAAEIYLSPNPEIRAKKEAEELELELKKLNDN